MSTVLISYASRKYVPSQSRLVSSAQGNGIDRCLCYSPLYCYRTGYFFCHHHILRLRRGAGYWLWKPYIIWRTLRSLPEGDTVVYLDVDNRIVGNLDPLIEIARRNLVVLFANHGRLNRTWTKRDCFVLMGCDTQAYHEAEQVDAAQILVRNSPPGREFIAAWLRWCENPRVLTDDVNSCGLPNLDGFQEHRWDQSVLSLLALRRKIELFRSPTHRGNHLKLPEHRIGGERLIAPYSAAPWANSPYGSLIDGQLELVSYDDRGTIRKLLSRSRFLRAILNFLRKRLSN